MRKVDFHTIRLWLYHNRRGERDDWTIVTQAGARMTITSDYGNPVERVVEFLRKAQPQMEVSEITR